MTVDSMISGKLTVRNTTFYSVSGKSRDQKQGQSAREVKDYRPSQVRFRCSVEPKEPRGVKSFFVEWDVCVEKEKVGDGRSDSGGFQSRRHVDIRECPISRPFESDLQHFPSQHPSHPCLNTSGSAAKRKSLSVAPLSHPKSQRR